MKLLTSLCSLSAWVLMALCQMAHGEEAASVDSPVAAPENLSEARSRALLMHELIRGTLQVMHRDFF